MYRCAFIKGKRMINCLNCISAVWQSRFSFKETQHSIYPDYEVPYEDDEENDFLIDYLIEVMIVKAEFDPPMMKIIDELVEFLHQTDVKRIMDDIGNDQLGAFYDRPYHRFDTFFGMLYWGKRCWVDKDARSRMNKALRELLGGDVQEVVKRELARIRKVD
jgi:hypothetical protein